MSQYKIGTARIVANANIAAACTAAQGAAGNVNVGLHSWKVTFVHSGGGESLPNLSSNVLDVTSSAKQVDLTSIPLGPTGTVSRKIYRRVSGDTGNWLFVGTIANNTATTFTDNIADGGLGVQAPTSTTFPTEVVELTGGGLTTGNIAVGNLFHFKGETAYFTVSSIIDATQFTLTILYNGVKTPGIYYEYAVNRDFTPLYGFPELSQRDIDTADTFTRAVRAIDSAIANAEIAGNWIYVNANGSGVSNVGAGEDDLMSFPLPAGSLSMNGDAVVVYASGLFIGNGNTKTLKFYFGTGSYVINAVTAAPNNKVWNVEVIIVRTGLNSQFVNIKGIVGLAFEIVSWQGLSQIEANPLTIKFTGEGVATNDILQVTHLVKLEKFTV